MTDILDRPPALVLDGDALDPIGGGGALVGYGRVAGSAWAARRP
ncbi:hypothetical protein ACQP2U_13640 [Nocardia sp. CA-084685]